MAGNYSKLAERLASQNAVSPAVRARTATFKQPDRKNGQKNRFPMPDQEHARLALQMLPRAKNMPAGMAAKVRARADSMLGK
jgi:hypothetical protein